ncbi:TadE family protein [Microbacterium sp. cx-59]|uniref:TadE family protein n=1 Tax=Microbacterium sp. cx-59 TaxID=2891207 RepID=UPI001E591431|nr:TadE family protein [Microbacterium sp. cx-59]MCC4908941.1 pilus assembly protein [Microbacterium sp. cx-59]
MSRRLGDRGSVSAEFAVALPAIVLLLVLCIGALSSASWQVRLQDATADAARLIARGDDEGRALALVAGSAPGAQGVVEYSDDLVCVTATAPAGIPVVELRFTASSCALGGGR